MPLKGLPKNQKYLLFALLSIYFLDNFGLAIAYPIFTPLIFKTHLGNVFDPLSGFSFRTIYLGLLLASFPIGQFIGAPILGYFADFKGRKKGFYLTVSGELLSFLLSAISIYFKSYTLLFLSRLLTGFFAGNLTICLSALADISGENPKRRATNFGLLASIAGISFILAIIVGGYFSDPKLDPIFSSSLPFFITSGLALINLVIIHFFYKEKEAAAKTSCSTFFFGGLNIPQVRLLFFIFFLFLSAWVGCLQFLSAIEIEHFKASKEAVTLTFISGGIIWAFSNGYLNSLLLKKLLPKHLIAFFIPIFAFALLGMALSYHFLSFLLFFNLGSFSAAIIWSNLLAVISIYTPADLQGRTLGFNQSITSLATFFSPLLGALLGSQNISLTYLSYVFLIVIAFFIFLLNKSLSKQ
ncbi:MAG: MFS transporter [Simkaniaceae bacterium]